MKCKCGHLRRYHKLSMEHGTCDGGCAYCACLEFKPEKVNPLLEEFKLLSKHPGAYDAEEQTLP